MNFGKSNGRTLFFLTILLTFLGLLSVADASHPLALTYFNDSFYFVKQQIMWIVVGFILMIVGLVVDYKVWKKFASVFFVINIILLILVVIPGVGTKVLGARRWLNFAGVTIQPSELIKFTMTFYIANLVSLKKPFWQLILPIVLVGGLVMLQPDLGTTISIIGIGFTQLFVAGVSLLPFVGTGIAGLILGFILIITSDYRRQRLLTFLNVSDHVQDGANYHIRQVLIALGSGGLFGVGLGQGRQKYLFLPESATDSVFATIAEELGFLGSLAVIGLLAFFVYKCLKIAANAPDEFATLFVTGITAWICIQIFLNIASMVALVPLTGVPLPFFSYGGSSLVVILFAVGVLLNIAKKSTIETKP